MLDSGSEDGFSFCWYLESFMVNICGIFMWSWLPGCPVEVDVEFVLINESNKEMHIISLGVYPDKCDAVGGAKGEYCGSGESSSCETWMRGSGESGVRDGHSLLRRVMSWEDVLEFVIMGDRGTCAGLNSGRCASLNCMSCSLADGRGEGGTGDGELLVVSMAFMQDRIAAG